MNVNYSFKTTASWGFSVRALTGSNNAPLEKHAAALKDELCKAAVNTDCI